MEIISWVGLSLLFFLVSYLAVVNVLEDLLDNFFLKIPAMLFISIPMGFLMAIFSYQPIFMIGIASIANYYRVVQKSKSMKDQDNKKYSVTYHFVGSYLYLFLLCVLGYYFQKPIEIAGNSIPYWKTLLPVE
jgi:hypothetical protein